MSRSFYIPYIVCERDITVPVQTQRMDQGLSISEDAADAAQSEQKRIGSSDRSGCATRAPKEASV